MPWDGRRPYSRPDIFRPTTIRFPRWKRLEFTHGTVSMPTRNLPQCACVWGGSPLDIHYPHRYNRSLAGDVDFVDIPPTVDVESRMWGGAHPQDLRIELVDAKNHWYTIHKNVKRQVEAGSEIPVKYLKALTHNIFDYSDARDFRRETMLGVFRPCGKSVNGKAAHWLPQRQGRSPKPTGTGCHCPNVETGWIWTSADARPGRERAARQGAARTPSPGDTRRQVH